MFRAERRILTVFKRKERWLATHIHILGICGTFMGGIALLARQQGFRVTGSDANVYPPMSTQLEEAGIALMEGFSAEHLQPAPDCVVVGNALSRGNPAVEYLLNARIPYTSGPQWLAENILQDKWVLAVSGTHGKTTTSSLLAWLLEYAQMSPGFLIGGVPGNFGVSARLGESDFFVVEADEYDTAFFDKRSKFIHYRPRTLCINNMEFDHADIFADLAAIQKQFHHVVRCVPGEGLVVHKHGVAAIDETLALGCWTPTTAFAIDTPNPASSSNSDNEGSCDAQWHARYDNDDGSAFSLARGSETPVSVEWNYCGAHNVENALSAAAAAHHVGVPLAVTAAAMRTFKGVKRRLELLGSPGDIAVYDDFAHHPTAIATTLQGLRAGIGAGRLLALIEPRSNTMRMGEHRGQLAAATQDADAVFWFQPEGLDWSLDAVLAQSPVPAHLYTNLEELVAAVSVEARPQDQIIIMSNGSFGGIHQLLVHALEEKAAHA